MLKKFAYSCLVAKWRDAAKNCNLYSSCYDHLFSSGLQSLTQVASMSAVDAGGNVHSGAPPPWLEAADQTLLNDQVKPALSSFISSNKSQKSRKLNPKRVGAAWAEK